jgi:hypothetical protein
MKHSIDTDVDNHIYMNTHPYRYMHVHPTPMSTSERLDQVDLEIHEIVHQKCIVIDEDIVYH